jgi:hypothetical protein
LARLIAGHENELAQQAASPEEQRGARINTRMVLLEQLLARFRTLWGDDLQFNIASVPARVE